MVDLHPCTPGDHSNVVESQWPSPSASGIQGCGLGLDVSVLRRSRDLSKVSSRACRQTSRSRLGS